MLLLILYLALLGGVYWFCGFIGVPAPFLKLILIVLFVIALLLVLNFFGVGIPNFSAPRLR